MTTRVSSLAGAQKRRTSRSDIRKIKIANRSSNGWLVGVSAVCIVLAIWEILSSWIFPSVLVPSFSQVLGKAYDLFITGAIFPHIWASLQRILLGFLIGSAVGAPIGLLMGSFRLVRNLVDPIVQFFRFVPPIAWLTPAVIWFGIGETSKVVIIFYTTVFIVAINASLGVINIPKNKLLAAETLGASRSQSFFHVVVPAALPFILAGMRLAMGNSFATVVSAEMIAADNGLGYLIFNSRLWMASDVIFVAILLLGFLGLLTDLLFRTAIRRFAGKYGPID
ncbi:ABC transporter permease [Pseudochelatococcus sp. B33]